MYTDAAVFAPIGSRQRPALAAALRGRGARSGRASQRATRNDRSVRGGVGRSYAHSCCRTSVRCVAAATASACAASWCC